MKIGILTFHRSYNYGAFMQCYSLSNRLKKDFPNCEVEVIDYASERMYKNYDITFKGRFLRIFSKPSPFMIKIKQLVKLTLSPKASNHKKALYEAFEKDIECLPLSDYRVISDDYKKLYEKIRGKYDVIIVGSDAVWEFIPYPFPNAYFLMEDLGALKMSYAASADRMHINMLTQQQKTIINQAMSNMYYIGIRDVSTDNLLYGINPDLQKHHTCDPTIFLDMKQFETEKKGVEKKLIDAGIDLSKPIIGLMCGDKIANRIISYFGNKYQYVSVYCENKHSDVSMSNLTPREWSVVFSFFSLTVTRFFHGTILSLKNETPTLTVDDWYMVDKNHITKLEDLYNRLDLKEHYCKISDFFDDKKFLKIIKKAEQSMYDKNSGEKIRLSLEKEAKNYCDFKQALGAIVNGTKQ